MDSAIVAAGPRAAFAALCLGAAAPAFAQASAPPPGAPSPDAASADAPKDIVVTASKIGANTERAPIAVTTVTPEQMQRDHILSVPDVAVRTPSLNYTTASNFALAYIRGLGSNFSLAGLESAVATYVDGVYLQRQAGAVVDLVDTSSIQVLKGPQGTLYGRNATGGAILVETTDPTHQFGGFVTGEYGHFDQARVEGAVNLPVSDTFAIRIAGQYKSIGNYFDDVYNDDRRGRTRSYYIRGKAKWEIAPNFTATYSLEYYHYRSTGYAIRESLPAPYCLTCVIYGIAPPVAKSYYDVGGTGNTYGRSRFLAQTLKLLYEGDTFTATSITGYRDQSVPYVNDQDSLGPNFFSTYVREHGPTLYNDNYVRTKFSSPLNFLGGLSYERERDTQDAVFFGDAFGPLLPKNVNKVRIDSISVYGEATYDFGRGFKLTAGARYNHDAKRIGVANNPDATAALSAPASFGVAKDFGTVTPRAVVSYQSGDGFYYASYNRGARSGGFGSPVIAPIASVKPETLDNFEIGAKNRFFDRRLQTTVAAFYGLYRNIQIQVTDAADGTVHLENAARGRVAGIEFDANLAVTHAFSLAGGVTWLDNRFQSYRNAAVFVPNVNAAGVLQPGLANGTEDLSGTPLPRSPKWAGYGSADYRMRLPGDWTLDLSGVARFTTAFLFAPGAGGPLLNDRQSGYTKVDATATLTLPSGKTEIGMYVQNMFAAHYAIQGATSVYGAFIAPSMPRTFGVRASQKF